MSFVPFKKEEAEESRFEIRKYFYSNTTSNVKQI